jgi:hypothetical protein
MYTSETIMFASEIDANLGVETLINAALGNNNFLSYNQFKKIVHGKEMRCNPNLGWSVDMLREAKHFMCHHFHIVELLPMQMFDD